MKLEVEVQYERRENGSIECLYTIDGEPLFYNIIGKIYRLSISGAKKIAEGTAEDIDYVDIMEIFGCFEADTTTSDENGVRIILSSREDIPALEETIKRYLRRGLKLLERELKDRTNKYPNKKTIVVSTEE